MGEEHLSELHEKELEK
jgi:hypothetical protein